MAPAGISALHALAVLAAMFVLTAADSSRAQEPAPPPLPPSAAPTLAKPPSGTTKIASLGPAELDWTQGALISPGYHPARQLRVGWIISGSVVFSVLYFWSAFTADGHYANPDDKGRANADALYVPVAGPFIQMSQPNNVAGNVFNVIDGLGQAAGIVMLVYGLTSPKTIVVRDSPASLWLPTPYLTPRGGGLACVGAF